MPSSYTPSLRLVLPVDGELDGTWGSTVNNGLTSLVDAAIAGTATVSMPNANYTLTAANEAADEARQMFIRLTGTLSAQRDVVCPAVSKLYFVSNETAGGFGINFKTAAGTGVVVPNGARMMLYCNGTNVVQSVTHLNAPLLSTPRLTRQNSTNRGGEVSFERASDGNTHYTLDVSGTGLTPEFRLFNTARNAATVVVDHLGGMFVEGGVKTRDVLLPVPNGGERAFIWELPSKFVYIFCRDSDDAVGLFDTATTLARWTSDVSGNFTASGSVSGVSDVRIKTDLTPIADALAKVNQLNGYTYTRTDTGARQTGLLAHEVQAVLPEAVLDNGALLSVAYGNMVGLLVEAIKEQSLVIAALTDRVEKLEGQ
jgi:hypothetical protein